MEQALIAAESLGGEPHDEQVNARYGLQECIEQYTVILGTLEPEYESGMADGTNLPSFEDLV